MSAAIVAFGAVSGLGRGARAVSAGELGESARVATAFDAQLEDAGLTRPFCARVSGLDDDGDRATQLLAYAMRECRLMLDDAVPDWTNLRVGLALGTSSGGMIEAERLFRAIANHEIVSPEQARRSAYFSPMSEVVARQALTFSPHALVLTACAASTIAIGLGMRWLARGACDVALVGGVDAVSVFVASGFEALRATTARLPSRPFCKDRDGMVLGEGAAVIALVRPSSRTRSLAFVTGFGASGDGVHITAPDRTGAGLARAATAALEEAMRPEIDLVSAHGTATPFNDAAESLAIRSALRREDVVVHPFKAQIGHTLGAAGVLESLLCVDAIRRDVVPASVVDGERDPGARARLLGQTTQMGVAHALKLSAAFGGANAALVIEKMVPTEQPARAQRRVYASIGEHVSTIPDLAELASLTGQTPDRLAKTCNLSRLALSAVTKLAGRVGELKGAGIVVGHAYATLDVNEQYNRRILERGARFAEPRKFPYTSPNACAGECSVAFGLTGPNLAVGSGLHGGLEALAVARELIAHGDVDRTVVVAVDAPEIAARALAEAAGWPLPPTGAVAVLLSSEPFDGGWLLAPLHTASRGGPSPIAPGHVALLPLCGQGRTAELRSSSIGGAFAEGSLERS